MRALVVSLMSAALAACAAVGTSQPSPSPLLSDDVRVLARWHTGTDAGLVALGFNAAWIPNAGAGTVSKVDLRTNRVTATIPVGNHQAMLAACGGTLTVHDVPHGSFLIRRCEMPSAVAVGAGSLWITKNDDNSLLRIDPATDRVEAVIPTSIKLFGLAAGPSGAWATDLSGSVIHVDAQSNRVVATVHVSGQPSGLAVTDDAVWVARTLDNAVTRIDPTSNTVVGEIPVGLRPLPVVSGLGAVWVRNVWNEGAGTISRIDPASNRVIATVAVGANAGRDGLDGLAVGNGLLWVGGIYLEGIDPETNRVVVRRFHQTNALAFGAGSIWTTDLEGTISRIEPPPVTSGSPFPW
jgi:DNA-binding beta-propeller fold protein YncE